MIRPAPAPPLAAAEPAARYGPHALAEAFEGFLGDPHDTGNEFSHARCAALDEAEDFPDRICARLREWGLHRYYVPVAHGGRLRDFEEPFALIRAVARRDLTVAIAHGKTFLGCVSAWVSAPADVAANLAGHVLDGSPVAWALTERAHGSDLLAGDVTATVVTDGYLLNGEKWLINNATRGDLLTVLARTGEGGGPRGFDVFIVDKRALPPGAVRCLPKERTHGIRGADISGFVLRDAPVGARSRIGAPGAGLEVVLKGLQLTRTLCTSLSLGASDHMLRRSVRFARRERRHGQSLVAAPVVSQALTDAYADHLLAEAVSLVATRSIQALTPELSVTSAVVKYLVPTRTDAMIAALSQLWGERRVVVEEDGQGVHKLARDHLIVALFDGNTMVNLNGLVNEFPQLARGYRRSSVDSAGLPAVFDLDAALPAFDPARQSMIARYGSSVVNALPAAVAELRDHVRSRPGLADAARLAERVRVVADELHDEMALQRPAPLRVPVEAFHLAHRYALCYAAAAAVGLWLGSERGDAGAARSLWADARWLVAVLTRVLAGIHDQPGLVADPTLLGSLLDQEREGKLLSLLPARVAEATATDR